MDIDALIANARAVLDKVGSVDQEVLLGDVPVTVRFWPLQGVAWRELTAQHPARARSVFDQNLGYNLDAVVRDYPKVYLVDGDDVTDVAGEKWHSILDVLSGPDLRDLAAAVWGLNEFEHQKRVAAAGKARAGGRKKKRS